MDYTNINIFLVELFHVWREISYRVKKELILIGKKGINSSNEATTFWEYIDHSKHSRIYIPPCYSKVQFLSHFVKN